jgi:hypothetical protein
LSANQFLLVTKPNVATKLNQQLHSRLEQAMDYFYPMREREIETGRLKRINLNRLQVTIHSIRNSDGHFETITEIKSHLVQ